MQRIRAIWQWRLSSGPGRGQLALWVCLSVLFVLFVPSQSLNGLPFWNLSVKGLGQALLTTTAFLALLNLFTHRREEPPRVIFAFGAALICYGIAWLFLSSVRRDLLYGQSDFLLAAAAGIVLAFAPFVLAPLYRHLAVIALGSGVLALAWMGERHVVSNAPQRIDLYSSHQPLIKQVYFSLAGPLRQGQGGAIERLGDGFVLVTGGGDFYALSWDGDALGSKTIPLAMRLEANLSPEERADAEARGQHEKITDMVLDLKSSPIDVYVSFLRRDPARRCFSVRVSKAPLPPMPATGEPPSTAWTTVFETTPCVPMFAGFEYLEAGGRMGWLGDHLLLTVGNFGAMAEHQPPDPQSRDSPYGKVLLLDRSGHHEIFTMGHRNAQGLLVEADRTWLTEHGPQGGDELNLLEQGRNYGYPLVSYGTGYGEFVWPAAPGAHDHGEFREPILAFNPSIGISNLIRVTSSRFAQWKDDLLIGSLKNQTLYRVRIRDDRPIYIEPIAIGQRIRDLVEGADGRIVIWTDPGRLVVLTPGTSPVGAIVFGRCQACHDSVGSEGTGITLKGIVGREVASVGGFSYSAALRRFGGVWTEERLDAFLADPDSYVPGSDMAPGRVPDPAERRALVAFLKTHK